MDIKTCAEGHASLDAANWLCPWCLLEKAKADAARKEQALLQIKHLVVGAANPRWHAPEAIYATRGRIADICDAATDAAEAIETLKADAARYRWLRRGFDPHGARIQVVRWSTLPAVATPLAGKDLDAAIDAARGT